MGCCGRVGRVSLPAKTVSKSSIKPSKSVVRATFKSGTCPKCGSSTVEKYTRAGGALKRYWSCLKGHMIYA